MRKNNFSIDDIIEKIENGTTGTDIIFDWSIGIKEIITIISIAYPDRINNNKLKE